MTETIHQTLYQARHPPITLTCVQLGPLSENIVHKFLATDTSSIVGIAASYDSRCILDSIAFSTCSDVLLITIGTTRNKKKSGKSLLRDKILCNPSIRKYGFAVDRIASSLYLDIGLTIRDAFDLQHEKHSRGSIAATLSLLSGDDAWKTFRKSALSLFFFEKDSKISPQERLALQAWASYQVASRSTMMEVPAINTDTFDPQFLQFLAKSVRDSDRLDALKPSVMKNDVIGQVGSKSGIVTLQSTRYKTRIRQSGNQIIRLETINGQVTGKAVDVRGKSAGISVPQTISDETILSATTVGKEAPTSAESQRSEIILRAFEGSKHLISSLFVQKIFFSKFSTSELESHVPRPSFVYFPYCALNDSQRNAVNFCLCPKEESRIGLIVGPPGTGKTTVIAAAVSSIIHGTEYETVWIVAQSNVAIKNVAEKLADSGFLDFALLVSNEFHFEWHEHLYHQIEERVIISTEFRSIVENEQLLRGSRVILCTMSMLCNRRMISGGFTRLVPIRTVIVDEASQIEVGEYLPLLSQFKSSLEKLVFIGDDKQLPPYGQEDIGNLRSVFEIPHLRKHALFLDTQYRMPQAIGNFISRHVYDGKLKTVHKISTDRCCRFVDVYAGVESSAHDGTSFMNDAEVNVIVHIARRYQIEARKFRIVTPYDAQRNALETALKHAGLDWEDKCFNVDSFQGNEDDHIILSLVRSEKPGFLRNERRVNVMLTRCKQSMLICSSKHFLRDPDMKSSLVGKLAAEWTAKCVDPWITVQQIYGTVNSIYGSK